MTLNQVLALIFDCDLSSCVFPLLMNAVALIIEIVLQQCNTCTPCSQYTIPHVDHNLCLAQRRLYFMHSVTDRCSPGAFLFLVHRLNSACLFFPSPIENIAHMLSKGNLCCKTIALKINLCVMYIKSLISSSFSRCLAVIHRISSVCACVRVCVKEKWSFLAF